MTSEYPTTTKNIYRLAKLMFDQHGDNAVFIAAKIAADMEKQGKIIGRDAWRKVVKAVIDYIDDVPPDDREIH